MPDISNEELQELQLLRKRRQKQLDRQNEYAKANYDRMGFTAPKGTKERIEEHYKSKGYKNLTEYVMSLIKADMD